MKQLPVCGMLINATIPLAGPTQLNTPQIAHDSSARVTSNTLRSPHISASVVFTLKALSINGNRDLILDPRVVSRKRLCQSHCFSTTSYPIRRRTDGSIITWAKSRVLAQSTSKIAKLVSEIWSPRNSNWTQTLHWRTTRFTRQQCSCTVHRQWLRRLWLWSSHGSKRSACPTVQSKFINHNTVMDVWTKSIKARSLAILWLEPSARLMGPEEPQTLNDKEAKTVLISSMAKKKVLNSPNKSMMITDLIKN